MILWGRHLFSRHARTRSSTPAPILAIHDSDGSQGESAGTYRPLRHTGHHRSGHHGGGAAHFGGEIWRAVSAKRSHGGPCALPPQRTGKNDRNLLLLKGRGGGEGAQSGTPPAGRGAGPDDCG